MGMAGRRLDLVVTEQSPDHGQALSNEQAAAGEAVPQVVDAQVPDAARSSMRRHGPCRKAGCVPRLKPGITQGLSSMHRMPRNTAIVRSPRCTILAPVLESDNRSSLRSMSTSSHWSESISPVRHPVNISSRMAATAAEEAKPSRAAARRGAETAVLVVREEPFAPALRVFVHEPAGIDALGGHLPDLAHGQHPGWDAKPAQR